MTTGGDGAQKLTIGSRASERYLRIYVKGPAWIRHELELKGAVAQASAAAFIAGASPREVFDAEYGRVVRWH